MKQLDYYSNNNLNSKDAIFNFLIKTLNGSIFTWDYFVDFVKCNNNSIKFKQELEILNELIGLDVNAFDDTFKRLIKENPQIREALLILIAVRTNKLKSMKIIDDISNMNSKYKIDLFNPKKKLTDEIESDLINFIHKSGLFSFFNFNITNLFDYCLGVEVGLDTNARKNRTGTNMEKIVEEFIENFCIINGCEYMDQATHKKILSKWNININLDKISRRFDFAIHTNSKLYLIEVNYYSGGGSKLKATAGEYKEVENLLKPQGIDFIWITDGLGWNTAKTALFETFMHNSYVLNLKMLSDGILEEIIIS